MSSREEILSKIQGTNRLGAEHPGTYSIPKSNPEIQLESFIEALQMVGAQVEIIGEKSLDEVIESIYPGKFVYRSEKSLTNGTALSEVDVLLIEGDLAVGENGAIWISEERLPHRVAPFICQHLVISIAKNKLVGNMHEAYAHLGEQKAGFGLFLAGPSKTADIEQSLVIGAHGARSLLVVIV